MQARQVQRHIREQQRSAQRHHVSTGKSKGRTHQSVWCEYVIIILCIAVYGDSNVTITVKEQKTIKLISLVYCLVRVRSRSLLVFEIPHHIDVFCSCISGGCRLDNDSDVLHVRRGQGDLHLDRGLRRN